LSSDADIGRLIAPEGKISVVGFLGVGAVAAALGALLSPWWWLLATPALVLGVFFLWFFRDPARVPPGGPESVVSPADGRVLRVETEVEDPRFFEGVGTRLCIFMSPVDVHVNRNPIDGEVEAVRYHAGKYFAAYSDKASLDNEQNAVVLRTASGRRLGYVQIAGFLARRIVCHLSAGDTCVRGERMGMIKLGSRVDIFVPGAFTLGVEAGDRVLAGETVLGQLE
jgi:phosphatidylserine decarboxylase